MAFVAKAAVGAVALGSVAVGGWGISEFVQSIEPEVKSLQEITTSLDTNKVGGVAANKALLASAKETSNENWWEWSYKYRFKGVDNSKWNTHFQSVNKGWGATAESAGNQTALNQACAKAYEKEKTILTTDSTTPTLKDSVEKLCMIGKGKQLTTS